MVVLVKEYGVGRGRAFDEDKVLEQAMHAFRRHGYATLSIRQLEAETGLTSGSIYNAYGDKQGLYRAAMAFYVNGFVAGRIEAHAGPGATLDELEGLFMSLFREPLNDGYGCLATNAAIEFGADVSPAGEDVKKALDLVATGVESVLRREMGPQLAAAETHRLVLLYQGLLMLSRGGRLEPAFEQAIRSQFEMLREKRDLFQATDNS